MLTTLPDTSERLRQELDTQTTLGPALMATRGYAAPEVEHIYTRVHALCQQVGATLELFPVLFGLWRFYVVGSTGIGPEPPAVHPRANRWLQSAGLLTHA